MIPTDGIVIQQSISQERMYFSGIVQVTAPPEPVWLSLRSQDSAVSGSTLKIEITSIISYLWTS